MLIEGRKGDTSSIEQPKTHSSYERRIADKSNQIKEKKGILESIKQDLMKINSRMQPSSSAAASSSGASRFKLKAKAKSRATKKDIVYIPQPMPQPIPQYRLQPQSQPLPQPHPNPQPQPQPVATGSGKHREPKAASRLKPIQEDEEEIRTIIKPARKHLPYLHLNNDVYLINKVRGTRT